MNTTERKKIIWTIGEYIYKYDSEDHNCLVFSLKTDKGVQSAIATQNHVTYYRGDSDYADSVTYEELCDSDLQMVYDAICEKYNEENE